MSRASYYAGMRCWNRGYEKPLSTAQAVKILMAITEEEKFNVGVGTPFKPQDNCIFIIMSKMLSQKDLTCDGNGVWKVFNGAKSHYFEYTDDGVSKIDKERYSENPCAVHIKRRYYWCQDSTHFSRVFWWAEDGRCDYAML